MEARNDEDEPRDSLPELLERIARRCAERLETADVFEAEVTAASATLVIRDREALPWLGDELVRATEAHGGRTGALLLAGSAVMSPAIAKAATHAVRRMGYDPDSLLPEGFASASVAEARRIAEPNGDVRYAARLARPGMESEQITALVIEGRSEAQGLIGEIYLSGLLDADTARGAIESLSVSSDTDPEGEQFELHWQPVGAFEIADAARAAIERAQELEMPMNDGNAIALPLLALATCGDAEGLGEVSIEFDDEPVN